MHPRLREAAEHLSGGRDSEAAAACEEVLLAGGEDASALHLLGVALTRLARHAEAIPYLQRAAGLAPQSAPVHVDLANAQRRHGNAAEASAAYRAALALDPRNSAARFHLAGLQAEQGDHEAAARGFAQVARDNPMDFEAAQRFVDCVAAWTRASPPLDAPAADLSPAAFHSVAVGFCTVDERKAARARATLERALAPSPCTFHVVRDARSLAEAFNRILGEVRADVVILCHDDIEVLTPRLDRVLATALEHAELVGIAGASRVCGPAVLWAGHPHVHGWVSYPRGESRFEAAPLSLQAGLVPGMQSLDGVFIAMRGALAKRLRFDAHAFDGFHFYDLDFTYRAWQAGYRLAVFTGAVVVHASEGAFDHAWQRAAERFRAKFPALDAPAGSPHWYGATFDGHAELLGFYARLRACLPA